MKVKLKLRYADNGIIIEDTNLDLLDVFEYGLNGDNDNVFKALGKTLYDYAVNSQVDDTDVRDEITWYCKDHNKICNGSDITIIVKPSYSKRKN